MTAWNEYRVQENRQEIICVTPFRKNIVETVTLYGTIKEEGRASVYAKGNARIEQVYVAAGDIVKAGDPLMKLQPIFIENEDLLVYEDVTTWTNNLYQTAVIDTNQAKEEIQAAFNRLIIHETQKNEEISGKAYTVYSPIDGMIISLSGETGDIITSIFPTAVVTDLEQLSVRMDVSESAMRQIKLGNRCTIAVPALSDGSYSGEIAHIDPYARETGVLSGGGTYVTEVIASVNNNGSTLRPGYQATVKVEVGQQKNALLVPFDSIAQDENGAEYVMVWTGKQAYRQDVVTGKEIDDYVQVLTGLTEKQDVIRDVNHIHFTESLVLYEAS